MNSVILDCPAVFAAAWLMPRLPALRITYPDLDIWLITLESTKLVAVECIEDQAIAVCGVKSAVQLSHLAFPEVLSAMPFIMDEQRLAWAPWLLELPDLQGTLKRAIKLDDARCS